MMPPTTRAHPRMHEPRRSPATGRGRGNCRAAGECDRSTHSEVPGVTVQHRQHRSLGVKTARCLTSAAAFVTALLFAMMAPDSPTSAQHVREIAKIGLLDPSSKP